MRTHEEAGGSRRKQEEVCNYNDDSNNDDSNNDDSEKNLMDREQNIQKPAHLSGKQIHLKQSP